MARVVFVHGIGTPDEGGAAAMKSAWVDALAAGSPPVVATELEQRSGLVWYRDWGWAAVAGGQGDADPLADLSDEQREFVEDLAGLWLAQAAAVDDVELAGVAGVELDATAGPVVVDGAQGPMRAVRSSVAALTRVPLFAHGGFSVLAQITRFNLWQVSAYVNDLYDTKAEVAARFEAAVDDDTAVVVAHSLGSVVAYEAIHRLGLELDLLVTIGSPLGTRRLIHPRLAPVGQYPASVRRWVNVADLDDPVATEPALARWYPPPAERELVDERVRNRGRFAWHAATAYLEHDVVRRAVWEALADG